MRLNNNVIGADKRLIVDGVFSLGKHFLSNPTFVCCLDSISQTSLVGAWSGRKLLSSYTGAAMRVRRSTDNALANIAFVGENFDFLSLNSTIGNASGFLETWYDQSSAANNLTQTNNSQQPLVVASGTQQTLNNRIAPKGISGSDTRISRALTTNIVNNVFSVVAVLNYVPDGSNRRVMSFGNSSQNDYGVNTTFSLISGNSGKLEIWRNGVNTGITVSATTKMVVSIVWNGTNGQLIINNSSFSTLISNSTNFNINTFRLFNSIDGVNQNEVSSNIAEVVAFNRSITTQERNSIEQNMAAYYGITVA